MSKYAESKLTQQEEYEPNGPDLIFSVAFGLVRVMTDEGMVRVNGLIMACKFLASSCLRIGYFNPAEKSLSIGEMQPKPTNLSSDQGQECRIVKKIVPYRNFGGLLQKWKRKLKIWQNWTLTPFKIELIDG